MPPSPPGSPSSGRHSRRGRLGGTRRGRKRGDVRAAALLLLAEAPAHGYHLIQQIAARSDGAWAPSPGSIYPALQHLEDEGLIEFERVDGRKTANLTGAGKTYVEEHREALGEPWNPEQLGRGMSAESAALNTALTSLMSAARHVMADGTPAQQARAADVVTDARRSLYGLLADDDR